MTLSANFLRRPLASLRRALGLLVLAGVAPLLGGCKWALLDPAGPIGADERYYIIFATVLMLIVVVPVIVLTLFFAWRYRESNTSATYAPDWHHSNAIEAVCWLVPCAIIAVLGTVTWISSHKLDPYRPIASSEKPLEVQVVSMDWKWLFIYPEQKVATVNELVMPVGRPVHFELTSDTVMNAFFIPQLGTQIYTMAGMQTQLSLQADRAGDYDGLSSNYSGGGFSDMHFVAHAVPAAEFQSWAAGLAGKPALDMAAYHQLAKPGTVGVQQYGSVMPTLFHDILNKCADGATCTDTAMKMSMAKAVLGGQVGLCTTGKPAASKAAAVGKEAASTPVVREKGV